MAPVCELESAMARSACGLGPAPGRAPWRLVPAWCWQLVAQWCWRLVPVWCWRLVPAPVKCGWRLTAPGSRWEVLLLARRSRSGGPQDGPRPAPGDPPNLPTQGRHDRPVRHTAHRSYTQPTKPYRLTPQTHGYSHSFPAPSAGQNEPPPARDSPSVARSAYQGRRRHATIGPGDSHRRKQTSPKQYNSRRSQSMMREAIKCWRF